MKWKFLFVKYNSKREKKVNEYIRHFSNLFWRALIYGLTVKKTIWLRSGRTYKHKWTTNFIQALTLAKNWLVCEKKITQVDINAWMIKFYANCTMYRCLIQTKMRLYFQVRNSINCFVWLPHKQMNTFVGTRGKTTQINHFPLSYVLWIAIFQVLISNFKRKTFSFA